MFHPIQAVVAHINKLVKEDREREYNELLEAKSNDEIDKMFEVKDSKDNDD